MPAKPCKPRIGVLALTLELYESMSPQLRPGREEWLRRDVLPALGAFADVSFSGAVFRREDVEQSVAAYEAEGADALLVVLLSYSPSQTSLPALKRTRLPIVVWNTQELFAIGDGFAPADMSANHGVHGTQDLCNVLIRSGVPFEYVTSHLRDPGAAGAVADFARAAAAVRRLRSAKVGLLGYPFPGMGDFALDTTHLAATLGCQWVHLPMDEYVRLSEEAEGEAADALAAAYRDEYDVADGVSDEDLRASAAGEIALRQMVKSRCLDALTYQFLAFGDDARAGTVPFVGMSRLLAEGVGFGGEGDVIAAAGSFLLNCLQPPASFTEIFSVDFGGNGVLMSHMGEANVGMARKDRKVRLVPRAKPIVPTRCGQLQLCTCFQPGRATLFALTLGPHSRWRMIASPMTVQDFGPLDAMQTPHFKMCPDGDVRDFLTAYAKAGGPHHNAVCFGDARQRLAAAARLLDAEYVEV